jgi:hypothetical protein
LLGYGRTKRRTRPGSKRRPRQVSCVVRPPHPLVKFVVFLVKDKGAPILVPEKHEEDQQ